MHLALMMSGRWALVRADGETTMLGTEVDLRIFSWKDYSFLVTVNNETAAVFNCDPAIFGPDIPELMKHASRVILQTGHHNNLCKTFWSKP